MYSVSGGQQPIVQDSGPAGGNVTGQGLSELNVTARCASPPCAANGTGIDGTIVQIQDAVSTNATGGHALSFSANALGGGLIEYGAFGGAATLPFNFRVNGVTYAFPFVTGGIVGPGTTVVSDAVCWNNTTGTLVKSCTSTPLTIGGTNGQIQYNNAGALGGFTMSGDATINTGTGAITVAKIGNQNISLGGTLTTAAAFTTSGANALTLTTTTTTNVTLPATGTGTLSTLAGSEAFTNKTYNGNTWTAGTGTLTLGAGKVATISNTLTLTATDGSTLAIGTGGTLGTAAYTAATAYMPSGVQLTNSLGADVALNNTANYFTGPTVAQGSTGTWFAIGTITLLSANQDGMYCKLWDGTTVAASAAGVNIATLYTSITLSGYITSPVGNIRISCRDVANTTGSMVFNQSGNSKDSTLTVFRVQ